jgi:uncharacterized protein (TIGR04255 family)
MSHTVKSLIPLGTYPSYKNPPVNEVFCGLRFHASDELRIPHIGLLWDKFRHDYPVIQHAPPIAPVKGEILLDAESGLPLPRVWFINKSDDQLIQFQNDRFYFNWRYRQSNYPRYNYVIEKFENELSIIKDFFCKFNLGEFKPIEYELCYINNIPKGKGWETIEDLPKIFSDFVWTQKKGRFLPNPELFAWQARFPLPANNGNLNVKLNNAIQTKGKVPLLVLELKTVGIGESQNPKAIREWFDLAHEWIVRGFTDLTTPYIQKIWEREKNA